MSVIRCTFLRNTKCFYLDVIFHEKSSDCKRDEQVVLPIKDINIDEPHGNDKSINNEENSFGNYDVSIPSQSKMKENENSDSESDSESKRKPRIRKRPAYLDEYITVCKSSWQRMNRPLKLKPFKAMIAGNGRRPWTLR